MSDLPVAAEWFSATWVSGQVALLTEPHVDPFLQGNIWYVRGRERDLVVDTGNGIAPLRPALERLMQGRRREIVALATHAHADHIGGLHEFERRLLHVREAEAAQRTDGDLPLLAATWSDKLGGDGGAAILPPVLVTALPASGFDPAAFRIAPVAATHTVEGGDLIDLGDRRLQVLDLPGHTPGSIGLWDETGAALYSGDAVYDGELLDMLPESGVEAYVRTMRRLGELPVEVVYPGHDEPFGRDRLRQLAAAYLALRED